jgi:hypothetical protein
MGIGFTIQSAGIDPVLPLTKEPILVPDLDAGMYFHVPLPSASSSAYPQDRFYIGAVGFAHLGAFDGKV